MPPALLGWKPQPDDPKDWIYLPPTDASFKIHPHVDLRDTHHMQREPFYQQYQDCTANAIASALKYGKNAEAMGARGDLYQPSRMFIYYFERLLLATGGEVVPPEALQAVLQSNDAGRLKVGNTTISRAKVLKALAADEGAHERDGFKILVRYGVCPDSSWEYQTDFAVLKPQALTDGLAYIDRMFTYWRIKDQEENAGDDLIKHMEAALSEGFPVVFGFRGSDTHAPLDLTTGLDSEFVYKGWVEDGDDDWGHAVVAVGFDHAKQRFLVLNSWGKGFGDGGYFYIPYRWFGKEKPSFNDNEGRLTYRVNDLWVVKTVLPQPGTLGTDVTSETSTNK